MRNFLSKNSRYLYAFRDDNKTPQKLAKTTADRISMNNANKGTIISESPNPTVAPIRLATPTINKI